MAVSSEATVDTPSSAFTAMCADWSWKLIENLIGGTEAMRAAGATWLPKTARETSKPGEYDARVAKTVLFPGFAEAVTRVQSRPFAKPVVIQGPISERLGRMGVNADRCGADLATAAQEFFGDLWRWGKAHWIVDSPPVSLDEEGEAVQPTLEQALDSDLRPYLVRIDPRNLIGWRSEQLNGTEVLTQIRVRETAGEPDGLWGDKTVKRVRVWTPTDWTLWQEGDKEDDWAMVEQGVNPLGEIPLVTAYAPNCKTGLLTAKPPFHGVAWLNLLHWQSTSEQRKTLEVHRTGGLFLSGVALEEQEKGWAWGAGAILSSVNPEASASPLEFAGAAIEAGRRDLEDLKEEMGELGMRPFVERAPQATATGVVTDEAKHHTVAQLAVRLLEQAIAQAFSFGADWLEETLAEDFAAEVWSEFSAAVGPQQGMEIIDRARGRGDLDVEMWAHEMQRRGALSDRWSPEEIAQRAEENEKELASLFPPPAEDDPDPDDEGKEAEAKEVA